MDQAVDSLRPQGRLRHLARSIIVILVVALATASVEAKRLPAWTSLNPQPTGQELKGMATDGQSVVVVGYNGTLLYRGPGDSQFRRVEAPDGSFAYLNCVAYGYGKWIAVGLGGEILFSLDGKQWDTAAPADTTDLNKVYYCMGKFIAIGNGGKILTSLDGMSWQDKSAPGVTADLLGVTCGPEDVVVVGREGTILTSKDGAIFTPATSNTSADLYDVAYGNGKYLAVGRDHALNTGLLLSATSVALWSVILTGILYYFTAVAFGNGLFVLGGLDGAIGTTMDGTGVQFRTFAPFGIAAVFFLLGIFWALGSYGLIMASANGVLWSVLTGYLTLFTFFAFLRFGALLLGMGCEQNVFASSNNGRSWKGVYAGSIGVAAPLVAAVVLLATILPTSRADGTTTGGRDRDTPRDWVIALTEDGTMLRSSDGLNWDVFARSGAAPPPLARMAYGNGVIVNVGAGGYIETLDPRDLETAAPQPSGTGLDLNAVIYTGTHFIAAGDQGTILASTDGVAWSKRAEGAHGSEAYNVLTYDGQGRAVAAGDGGKISAAREADNFETWDTVSSPDPADFTAAGSDGDGTVLLGSRWGSLYASAGGADFEAVGALAWQTPRNIYYDRLTDAWYAVGENGLIQRYLRTPRFLSIEYQTRDRLRLEWEPDAGNVSIQTRTDPFADKWEEVPGLHSGFSAIISAGSPTALREFRIGLELEY